MRYKTGDHKAIWPINSDNKVDCLLGILGLSDRKNVPMSIKTNDSSVKIKVPTPTTLEALVRCYLEICAPVAR